MTDTERIANAAYDRHADLSTAAANLGRLAAQCDLRAAHPNIPEWARIRLHADAAYYREAQAAELEASQRRV